MLCVKDLLSFWQSPLAGMFSLLRRYIHVTRKDASWKGLL